MGKQEVTVEPVNNQQIQRISNLEFEKQDQQPVQMWKGYVTVLTGILVHLFAGNLYLWGNITNYVVSYFHYLHSPGANLTNAQMVLPLCFVMQGVASPSGAFMLKRMHPKVIMLLGTSIMCLAMLLASYQTNWWGFVVFWGIMYPIGIGMIYWLPIICGWEYFPKHKGLVSGIVVGGYGFGSFIFGFISTAICNPDDEKVKVPDDGSGTKDKLFSEAVANRVPGMLRFCLIFWALFSLAGIIGVFRHPVYAREQQIRNRQQKIDGFKKLKISEEEEERLDSTESEAKNNFITVKDALTSRRFYHMSLILFLGIFYGVYISSVYKLTAQDFLLDHQLTLAGALGSVCNGCSRIFWASLQDKFGFKRVYFCLLLIQLGVSFTIFLVRKNVVLYTIWVCLSYLCEGGHFSMFPTAAVNIFGIENGGQIFSIMFQANSCSAIASFVVVQLTKENKNNHAVFNIAGILTAINFVLLYFFDDQPMKKPQKEETLK